MVAEPQAISGSVPVATRWINFTQNTLFKMPKEIELGLQITATGVQALRYYTKGTKLIPFEYPDLSSRSIYLCIPLPWMNIKFFSKNSCKKFKLYSEWGAGRGYSGTIWGSGCSASMGTLSSSYMTSKRAALGVLERGSNSRISQGINWEYACLYRSCNWCRWQT